MSTTARGISNHETIHLIERLTKWLISLGYNPDESERGAIQMALASSPAYTRAQARETALQIMAEQQRLKSGARK